MVVSEHPAEPRVAANLPREYRWSIWHDRFVPKPLMWGIIVIVFNILADQVVKMLPANWHEVIEAFSLERFDKPLDVSIHRRRFDRQRIWLHTFALKCLIELSRVEHIFVSHKNSGGCSLISCAIIGNVSATLHIQSLVGCRVDLVTMTLWLSMCIKTSVVYRMNPLAVSTLLANKSHDQSFAACRFKNLSHTGSVRSGAGPMPCSFRIDRTVDLETNMILSFRSSSSIRVYPQLGVLAMWRTSFFKTRFVGGRPI